MKLISILYHEGPDTELPLQQNMLHDFQQNMLHEVLIARQIDIVQRDSVSL